MNDNKQEGPVNRLQPAQIYTTCTGCKYHEQRLAKSGNNPIYRDDCSHETAPKPFFFTDGNLVNLFGYPEPGEWCPFKPVNKIELP